MLIIMSFFYILEASAIHPDVSFLTALPSHSHMLRSLLPIANLTPCFSVFFHLTTVLILEGDLDELPPRTFAKWRCICFDKSFLPHSVTPEAQSFASGCLTLCIQCNWRAGPSWCSQFPAAQHDVLTQTPLDCSSCALLMFTDNSCSHTLLHQFSPSFTCFIFFFSCSLLLSTQLHTHRSTSPALSRQ